MEKNEFKTHISSFPTRPGVYQFLDSQGHVLYVGKALSIKDRLSHYALSRGIQKTELLVHHSSSVSYIETGSEFEAVILEANLIKRERPKYNVIFRDDKSFLYVFISKEEDFPKVYVTRKPKHVEDNEGMYFGPFPSSLTIKRILRFIRRIFPYCQQKNLGNRPCFYSHLGLCNPCPSVIVKEDKEPQRVLKKKYRQNIFHIIAVLSGKIDRVEKDLEKRMKILAYTQQFEEAALVRNQLLELRTLREQKVSTKSFLENPNFFFERQRKACHELLQLLRPYVPQLEKLTRIECYDISNFQGEKAVGSQVVFIDGVAEKQFYRRYKILMKGPNDVKMLQEMLNRRLNHLEWEYPDLLVIDGGKPQVGAVRTILKERQIEIPVVGLAKRLEEIIIPTATGFQTIRVTKHEAALQLLQALRDEAHRFALALHRKLLTPLS